MCINTRNRAANRPDHRLVPCRIGSASGYGVVLFCGQQAERAAGRPTAFLKMKTVLTIATADWAPRIELAARRFAAACAVVFVAGWALGTIVHRLNDQLTALLVRKRRPLLLPPARDPAPEPLLVPCFAITPVVAHSGFGCAADPMTRAVRLARKGLSQRKAAAICGVKRSSLQRALKAA